MTTLKQLAVVTVGITLASSVATLSPAQAFMVYTDANGGRAAWEAAITSQGYNFTTDTFSTNRANAPTITFDSGVVSTGTNGSFNNTIQAFNGARFAGLVETAPANFGAFDDITWTFPTAVVGFAADWFDTANAAGLTVSGNFDGTGSQTVNFFNRLGGSGTGFLGIVGTTSFNGIVFDGALPNSNQSFLADNLSFSTTQTTPIPTPALLPGLVGLGLAAWRKRKVEA